MQRCGIIQSYCQVALTARERATHTGSCPIISSTLLGPPLLTHRRSAVTRNGRTRDPRQHRPTGDPMQSSSAMRTSAVTTLNHKCLT